MSVQKPLSARTVSLAPWHPGRSCTRLDTDLTLLEVGSAAGGVGSDHLYPLPAVSHRRTSPVPAAIGQQWVIAHACRCNQLALFATFSYHGSSHRTAISQMVELEVDHRRHAEIENAIRDLGSGCRPEPHARASNFAAHPEPGWRYRRWPQRKLARRTGAQCGWRLDQADREHQGRPTTARSASASVGCSRRSASAEATSVHYLVAGVGPGPAQFTQRPGPAAVASWERPSLHGAKVRWD